MVQIVRRLRPKEEDPQEVRQLSTLMYYRSLLSTCSNDNFFYLKSRASNLVSKIATADSRHLFHLDIKFTAAFRPYILCFAGLFIYLFVFVLFNYL